MIRYTVASAVDGKVGDPVSMTAWLDAKTNLPVQMAMTGGGSDVRDVTETYTEFTLDAEVDAKLFELP